MSGLDWQAPDFLSNTSNDDYLASLASFLDGANAKYDATAVNALGGGGGDLSVYGSLPPLANLSSPELTSDSGASPASSDGTANYQGQQRTMTAGSSSSSAVTPSLVPAQSSQAPTPPSKPHDKRKGGPQTTQAIKDRRSSSGKPQNHPPHHSHPDGVDGDITRSASPEEEDGKKGGGKKTSEKRKAQNRAAQRNFRERKEKHLKELEDKVGLLEQRSNDQEAENSALKQLLQELKSENDRLKVFESAFSFSYDKDVNNSSTMPTSSTFVDAQPPPLSSSSSSSTTSSSRPSMLPATSSSSTSRSPNASFSFDNSSFDLPASNSTLPFGSTPSFSHYPIPPTSQPGGPSGLFPDNLFLNSLTVPSTATARGGGEGESPISPATNASSTRSSSYLATPPPPPSLPPTTSGVGGGIIPTASTPSGDLFASYRDPLADLSLPSAPLATLGDFDQLFGIAPPPSSSSSITPMPDTTSSLLSRPPPLVSTSSASGGSSSSPSSFFEDSMAQFIKSPSPLDDSSMLHLSNSPSATTTTTAGTGGRVSPATSTSTTSPCPYLTKDAGAAIEKKKRMVTIYGEPGFPYDMIPGEKYEFDLDNLCEEMKLKATCQEAARQALASAMAEDAKITQSTYPHQL
ncbi:hypothetical protein JCM3766R1_000066 [Sporobolomyces carnicolor]